MTLVYVCVARSFGKNYGAGMWTPGKGSLLCVVLAATRHAHTLIRKRVPSSSSAGSTWFCSVPRSYIYIWTGAWHTKAAMARVAEAPLFAVDRPKWAPLQIYGYDRQRAEGCGQPACALVARRTHCCKKFVYYAKINFDLRCIRHWEPDLTAASFSHTKMEEVCGWSG